MFLCQRWEIAEVRNYGKLLNPDFWIEVLPYNETTVLKGKDSISISGFYLILQRKSGPYFWLYFAPSFLMVLTSWISFAVSFEAVPGRLGLHLTLLLMMINMSNSISASIPKSDSMCPLILWILISIIFIIFALIEYFIILFNVQFGGLKSQVMWTKKDKNIQNWALGLDKTCLAIFPAAYLACVLVFILQLFLTVD